MLTLFISTLLLAVCIFFVKKNFWLTSKAITNLSLEQSFLCWYTLSDMGKPEQAKHRWVFIVNNITNLIIAFCFLVMMVCVALIGLSLL